MRKNFMVIGTLDFGVRKVRLRVWIYYRDFLKHEENGPPSHQKDGGPLKMFKISMLLLSPEQSLFL